MTFTTTHKLNQTLALLQQLPGNSDLVPLVLAPVDAGKTSLWQQLCSKAPAQWRLAAVGAHEKMTRAQLMRHLVSDWMPGKEEISYGQFIEELKQIERQGQLPVLALDDADALSPDLLNFLGQLPIALICFAEHPPGGSEDGYQLLPLSPWNAEEVAAFVRLRRGAMPSNWELDRLLLACEGLPGRLVRLLEKGTAPAAGEPSAPTSRATQPVAKAAKKGLVLSQARLNLWLGVLAVILVLALGLVFNKERIGQGVEGLIAELKTSETEDVLTPGLEPDVEAVVGPLPLDTDLTPPPLSQVLDQLPELQAPVTRELPETQPEAEVMQESKPLPEPETNVEEAARDSFLHGPEWLLQQPADHYGLQMVELDTLEALETYAKKYQLTGTVPLSWLATNGKKPGYLLILGSYPAEQAAAKARLMLPDAINIDKVKVRGFAELQRQIGSR